jgi:hypothetical protein
MTTKIATIEPAEIELEMINTRPNAAMRQHVKTMARDDFWLAEDGIVHMLAHLPVHEALALIGTMRDREPFTFRLPRLARRRDRGIGTGRCSGLEPSAASAQW